MSPNSGAIQDKKYIIDLCKNSNKLEIKAKGAYCSFVTHKSTPDKDTIIRYFNEVMDEINKFNY